MDVQTTTTEQRFKDPNWLIILVFSLLLSTLILAWQSRPQVCLQTSLNLSLDIKLDRGVQRVDLCSQSKPVPFDSFLNQEILQINRRLATVSRVLESFNVQGARLGVLAFLPEDFSKPGYFESRILARGLWQTPAKNMTQYKERQLFQSAVDHFWFWGHRSKDQFADWEMAYWNQALLDSFEVENVIFREKILRLWFDELSAGKLSLLNPQSDFFFRPTVLHRMKHLGYDLKRSRLSFAKAVVLGAEQSPESVQLFDVVTLNDDRFRPQFSKISFDLTGAPALHMAELFVVVCRWPYVDELQFSKYNFQNLILVQNCDPWSDQVVNQALKDLRVFAVNHPEMNFLKIHWASFQLALSRSGVRENFIKNLFSENTLKSFVRAGVLSEIAQEDITGVKIWKGAIEPFPIFRVR